MKRIFLIALFLILIACDQKTGEEALDPSKIVEVEEPELDYESLYQEVIDRYQQYDDNPEFENFEDTNQYAFLYNMEYFDAIAYTFVDINDDGKKEMLTAFRKGDTFNLIDLHTIDEDVKVVRLSEGHERLERMGERIQVFVLEDGSLYEVGGAGTTTVYALYEFDEEATKIMKVKEELNNPNLVDEDDIIDLTEFEWTDITSNRKE